jgi:SSS family solute:Na+ symporter
MAFLLILGGYAALMVAFAAVVSRRVNAPGAFFVAGRGLGAGLIFSTMLAANIGAGSTVGAAGLGYRDGISAWWWVGSAGIGSLILALAVGPKIYSVAKAHNLLTVGDYLEHRYNRNVRGLVALLLWAGSLSILSGQLIAVAWILNVVAGASKPVGCLIAGAVVTAYFSLGGLHAAARVNVIQLAVKLTGFALALYYLLAFGHGLVELSGVPAATGMDTQQAGDYLGFFSPRSSLYLATLVPSFVISPGLIQKAFGARDERAVRVGVGLNSLGLLAYAIVPVLIGVIARSQFPELSNHELALPTLLTKSLPFWLGALLLSSIFSAELSAADAALFMLSTSLSKDIYHAFLRPQASDRELMRFARAGAIGCGVIAALVAMLLPSVIDALKIFYSLLTAALLLPLLAGLYTKRVSAQTATVTLIVSVVVTFAVELLTGGSGLVGLPPTLVGGIVGLAVMLVGTLRLIRTKKE